MSELFAPDLYEVKYPKRGSLYERFIGMLDRADSNGCLLWAGGVDGNGRGHINYRNKMVKAPRVAYLIANGPFDEDLSVLHSCDNPLCVEPSHLRLGTQADNMNDKATRGRCRNQYTGAQAPLQESR